MSIRELMVLFTERLFNHWDSNLSFF